MASILPFPSKQSDFDDEATRRMGEAFDAACLASRDQSEIVKEMLAKKIIEAAKEGERDPSRLCDVALAGLGIKRHTR